MITNMDLSGTAFETGYEILQERGFALVGMSPGNSYFKRERIKNLLAYCAGVFSKVRIMIADKPAEHTYKALGYPPVKAERKARSNGNTLQNHCQGSIDEILDGNIKLVEWKEEIAPHTAYTRELQRINELYSENILFRTEARTTTRTVLEGKLKLGIQMESALDEGVHYLLEELAFISASPEILGANRIAYIYHTRWRIYEDFVDGKFDGRKREDLGFVLIE